MDWRSTWATPLVCQGCCPVGRVGVSIVASLRGVQATPTVKVSGMSGIMSRWPVLLNHRVTHKDLDDDGAIRDEEFLERSGLQLRRNTELQGRRLLGRPASVITTAGVTEVHPNAFTIAVRLRPVGGDRETPLNQTWGVRLEDPRTGEVQLLTDDIRDELIALAHAAEHFN
jgi:hypothetical protein